MTKVSSNFAKVLTGLLSSDPQAKLIERNEKLAKSSVKQHISALEFEIVQQEEQVEEAKTALQEAQYPVKAITNGNDYINLVSQRASALKQKEASVERLKETLKFYEDFSTNNF